MTAYSGLRFFLAVSASVAVIAGCTKGAPAPDLPTPPVSAGVQSSAPPTPTAAAPDVVPRASKTVPTPSPTPTPVVEASPAGTVRPAPPPTPAPSPSPAPILTPQGGSAAAVNASSASPPPPDRDLFELALRLRPGLGDSVSRTVNPQPVSYREGHEETFWVADLVDASARTIQATLKVATEHAYFYVDDTLDLSIDDLRKASEVFEREIHPLMTESFGDIWNPGVDNDPHLTILHTPLRGADGYYGSQDEYPRKTHPRSNQREMVYMDGNRLRPGSPAYLSVLTHEFQHAVHWNMDSGEESWVNEGMSEVAKDLAGYRGGFFVSSFLGRSDTQLNYWPDDLEASAPHYGAATLFLSYLAQQYGGYEGLRELAREPADGIEGVEAYLSAYGKSFLDVFSDWVVANYLDAPDGPFGYPDRDVRVREVDTMVDYGERRDTLPQFASRYIDLRLPEGDAVVSIVAESQVAQVGTKCRSGRYCWWGNRGDSIDSTLTREVDLSGLSGASLEFWTWFRVEEDWDYAYVEVSADGGGSWTILEGQYTTTENPIGNNFGHGLTGASDGWVREKMDLSPYAGGKVLLRFEYVTDDAVYLDGFLVDDLAIPELGIFDDAEQDRRWKAEGFVRIDNVLSQDYMVQVIERAKSGDVAVRRMRLGGEPSGQVRIDGFGSRLENAVIVVSPVARGTHQPARYTLTVSPAKGP